MRIRRVAVIAIAIMSASVAAGAEGLNSPWPQDVRININVSEMATLSIDETIELTPDPEDANSLAGVASVDAEANFDYQVSTQWLPEPDWTNETVVLNDIDGIHDALYAASGEVSVEATLGTEATSTDEPAAGVATATTSVYYDNQLCGVVQVTLTHAPAP